MAKNEVPHVHAGHLHLGELELYELKFTNGLLPQRAVTGVVHRDTRALLDNAQRHGRHAGALGHEVVARTLTTPALCLLGLAQEAITSDAHVTQKDVTGRRGVLTHLSHRCGLRESVHSLIEDEGQYRSVAKGGVR